jgi:aminopeptidase N
VKVSINIYRIFWFSLLIANCFLSSAQLSNQSTYYKDSSEYDVTFYSINLQVADNSKYINGFTIISSVTVNKALNRFYIELSDSLVVDSLFIDSAKMPGYHGEGWVKVLINNPIGINKHFTCIIYYHGTGTSISSFGGMDTTSFYSSKILYTLSEPFNSFDFFPCKQILPDKADSVFVTLTVPKGQVAVSNGILKSKVEMPGNKIKYCWETRYPVAYYLIAFAVSDYKEYSYYITDEQFGDSILFQNYIMNDPDYLYIQKENIERTEKILKLFERLTGVPYPFRKEKYGHAIAPIGGGMENQTITILQDFKFDLVAHELGHSWFGDLVTCSDWQNIWINEGFASYMEFLAIENIYPDLRKKWLSDAFTSSLAEPKGSVYVPEDEKWNETRIFSSHLSYKKGAMIIHMLRKKINNDSVFFTILKTYLNSFAFSNASADDFKNKSREVTGSDFEIFFNQWFYGKGFPKINVEWGVNKNMLTVNCSQTGTDNSVPLFDCDLFIHVKFFKGSDSLVNLHLTSETNTFILSFPSKISYIEVNPDFSLLADIQVTPPIYFLIDDSSKQICIFPNPFKDSVKLTFQNILTSYTIELFDINGEILGKWENKSSSFSIKTESLHQGEYILNVTSRTGNKVSFKILKQ